MLAAALVLALWAVFLTPAGRAARTHPRQTATDVRGLVAAHPVATGAAYLSAYVVLGVLCLPVWWLQLAAGVAFGLWAGGALSLIGSVASAVITTRLADWFAGDGFHRRFQAGHARLRRLDRALGHNGLLTVMTVRLTHVVPFGLSNVAFGLIGVGLPAVAVGTLVGNVPAVAAYVGLGAGYHLWDGGPFAAGVVVFNVAMLVPLAVGACLAWCRRASVSRPGEIAPGKAARRVH